MDDLLDLNWSSSHQGQKPAAPAEAPPPANTSNPSSFDFLAKPTNSTNRANYYSTTPLQLSSPVLSLSNGIGRLNPPARLPGSGTATPSTSNHTPNFSSSADAFSSLLSIPSRSGGSSTLPKTESLAERQARLAEEKRKQAEHDRQQFQAHGAFWDSLEAGGNVGPPQQRSSSPFDDLLQLKPAAPGIRRASAAGPSHIVAPSAAPPRPKSSTGTFLDDDDLLSGPSSPKSVQTAPASPRKAAAQTAVRDPWHFDALPSSTNVATAHTRSRGGTSGMRTPVSDFDFGEGDGNDGSDEDILEDVGKPTPARRKPETTQRNGQSRRSKQNQPGHRASSPPPHIVGRIVEMGFSPGQARDALAKIPSGMDVEAALELLLAQTTGHGGILEAGENRVERERAQREAEERERRRRRRAGPSRDSVKPRSRGRDEESEGDQAFEAETILAQASDLGQSVLSKASLFWNSGKERAMKVYEEQRKAMEAGEGPAARKGKAVRDGRPRWMVEAEGNGVEEGWRDEKASGGFRDDDETSTPRRSVSDASSATLARQARDAPNRAGSSRHAAADETPDRSVKERADLLFGEEPKSYVPAARHRQTAASSTGTPRTASPAPPAPLPSRALVDAMSSQIQSSASFKAKGNDHLKLGRFPEAEAAYAAAINALPEGHLFLIPLYNNRAATRLKLGESASAANDCTKVIDLVGPSYHPSKEAPLPKKVAAEVKLADALVKATIKRAQAWEMGEKWKSAAEDWGRVMAFDGILLGPTAASMRNLAAEGGWRSKRMLEGVSSPVKPKSAPSRGAPRITVPPTKPVDVTESQAVTDLRKANRATEAEDGQRLALKDVVDTKLSVWKSGKESNLRALIASLDTALWDEILSGGLKVGMHELIAEKQVKIKYMKVIARLHPDKASKTAPFVFHCADGSQQLDLKNTTLEQRMLANGAFSALNDAWQAFNNP